MDKKDLKIEYMRGQGPGGQHRNKTESACRITHIPTGISAYCDERSQKTSYREAMKDLQRKLKAAEEEKKAEVKKARRDAAIKETKIIRTYDFKRDEVYDHRSKKRGTIKQILEKGEIERLR